MCPLDDETLDINLCYQALGSSVGDAPTEIEDKYQRLMRKCKAELRSEDQQVREEARTQILVFEDMYVKVKSSVSYQSMAREEQKREWSRSAVRPEPVREIRGYLTHCPSCNVLISKSLKKCPVCKTDFRSGIAKVLGKFLPKLK